MNKRIWWMFSNGPHLYFASAAGISDGGGGTPAAGGGSPAPSPAPASGGGSGIPPGAGQPSGQGQGSGQGSAPVLDQGGIRQLREAYDGLKSKYEPYEKLGDVQQLTQQQQIYQNVFNQVNEIGSALGYPEDEIVEAFQADPVATLDYLRRQAAQNEGQQPNQQDQLMDQVREMIDQGLSPIYEQQNVAKTNEANALFDRTVHGAMAEHFKKEGVEIGNVDKNITGALKMLTSEILKYDTEAIKSLKFEGKTAGVQQAFQKALDMAEAYYLARRGMEAAPANIQGARPGVRGGKPTGGNSGNGKSPTLDEIIDNPGVISQKYR